MNTYGHTVPLQTRTHIYLLILLGEFASRSRVGVAVSGCLARHVCVCCAEFSSCMVRLRALHSPPLTFYFVPKRARVRSAACHRILRERRAHGVYPQLIGPSPPMPGIHHSNFTHIHIQHRCLDVTKLAYTKSELAEKPHRLDRSGLDDKHKLTTCNSASDELRAADARPARFEHKLKIVFPRQLYGFTYAIIENNLISYARVYGYRSFPSEFLVWGDDDGLVQLFTVWICTVRPSPYAIARTSVMLVFAHRDACLAHIFTPHPRAHARTHAPTSPHQHAVDPRGNLFHHALCGEHKAKNVYAISVLCQTGWQFLFGAFRPSIFV